MRQTEQFRLLKARVNDRVKDWGLSNGVPPRCWRDEGVRQALAAACGRIQSEDIDLNDDDDYAAMDVIEDVCRAVIGVISRSYDRDESGAEDNDFGSPERQRPRSPIEGGDFGDEPGPHDYGTAEDEACAQAQGEFLAWQISRDIHVREFREEFLGGVLLEPSVAWEQLTSPLWKLLRADEFQDLGLLPSTATGRVISGVGEYWQGKDEHHLPVYARGRLRARRNQFGSMIRDVVFDIEVDLPGGGKHHQTVRRNHDLYHCVTSQPTVPAPVSVIHTGCRDPYPSYVPYPYNDKRLRFVEGYPRTAAGSAIYVCEVLQWWYPVETWSLLDFLLTGRPPRCAPILAQSMAIWPHIRREAQDKVEDDELLFFARGPASLLVQPWVQPEDLAGFWRSARGKEASRTLPLGHNLDMFRFVLSETPPGNTPRWESLCRKWNASQNTNVDRATLLRAFQRTRAALFPNYHEGPFPAYRPEKDT